MMQLVSSSGAVRQMRGKNVKEHELAGRWIIIDTSDQKKYFEFKGKVNEDKFYMTKEHK